MSKCTPAVLQEEGSGGSPIQEALLERPKEEALPTALTGSSPSKPEGGVLSSAGKTSNSEKLKVLEISSPPRVSDFFGYPSLPKKCRTKAILRREK